MVFTQPHAGDPSWLAPVVELDDSTTPATPIEYTDSTVLEGLILDLSRARARAAGFNAGAQFVLDTFGLTTKDFLARKKANAEEKKQKEVADVPAP
jgi:hypothetical protein